MAPIGIDGDDVTEITMDGDQITEVTMDGDVVWTSDSGWEAGTTLLENFEGYSSQAALESAWDFGVAPAAYELGTSNALAGSQDLVCAQDTAHAPNTSIGTSWGETFSVVFVPGHSNNSPGLSVKHQPNWGSRLDDCYWTQVDFGNDVLQIYERVNGTTTPVVSDSLPSLNTSNHYRVQVSLNNSDEIRAELYDRGQDPSESPHSDTGFGSPGTVHSGGHIMLNSGREGNGNTRFDNVRQH